MRYGRGENSEGQEDKPHGIQLVLFHSGSCYLVPMDVSEPCCLALGRRNARYADGINVQKTLASRHGYHNSHLCESVCGSSWSHHYCPSVQTLDISFANPNLKIFNTFSPLASAFIPCLQSQPLCSVSPELRLFEPEDMRLLPIMEKSLPALDADKAAVDLASISRGDGGASNPRACVRADLRHSSI